MADKGTLWQRLGSLGGRTLIVLAVLIVLTAAADRSGILSDWSADRRFTLSPRLTALIQAQQQPVELVGIWGGEDHDRLEPITAMLTRMAAVSPKVTWRRIDPELQKPLLTQFATRFKEAQIGNLYVTRGDRAFAIGLTAYTRLVLQREVGGALVTLAEDKLPPAYVLQGHGELRASGNASPGDGGGHLLQTLSLAGFQVTLLDGTNAQQPSPSGVLVVPGPTSPLGERDLKLLEQHLRDGGGLLVLADDRAPDDLVRWLRRKGLFVGGISQPDPGDESANPSRITVSMRRHFVGQEAAFPHHNLALDGELLNPQHPITTPVAAAGVAVISPWTSPVWLLQPDPNQSQENNNALIARYHQLGTQPFSGQLLLRSAEADAWDKPRAAPLEAPADLAQRQPLPLAWAVEYQAAADSVQANVGGRLVLWGSRQAACDGVLAQVNFANERFLRQAAAWAARRTAVTDIPEAEVAAFQVTASDNGLFYILALLLAVVPCVCLGAAMLTWWDRR